MTESAVVFQLILLFTVIPFSTGIPLILVIASGVFFATAGVLGVASTRLPADPRTGEHSTFTRRRLITIFIAGVALFLAADVAAILRYFYF